jgi:hypothetical protein
MLPTCAALVIPGRLNSPIRIEEIDHDLASRQVLVEGNVRVISYMDWLVYLNDEAEVIPLPLNLRAEVLIREAGVPLEEAVGGTAVFLGNGTNGWDTDAPVHLLRLAERLFDTALAA